VCVEYPNGTKEFFEGEEGRLVREEFPNGTKKFFVGEKGIEMLVRIEFPNGKKEFYEYKDGDDLVRTEPASPPSPPPTTQTEDGTTDDTAPPDDPAHAAKRPRVTGPVRDEPNGKPEREFVRKVAAEWEATGIEVKGKERADEVTIRLDDGTTEHLDMHCSKGERVCLVEFKASSSEFKHGTGQLLGYAHCMRNPAHDAGDGGVYAAAHAKGTASLCVATPTKPKQAHIDSARDNVPSVGAWWPGCPPPL
jgi:hypothetical protein